MAKKFSIRKLLFVGMLSIAGLFGASAAILEINSDASIDQVSKVSAESDPDNVLTETVGSYTYKIIYYFIDSGWEKGKSFTDSHGFYYNSGSTSLKFGQGTPGVNAVCSYTIGDYAAKIYLPSTATDITFVSVQNASSAREQTQKYVFSNVAEEYGEDANCFVVNKNNYSSGSNATGVWRNYNDFITTDVNIIYFTVISNWNGGHSNLTADYVWCRHDGVDTSQRDYDNIERTTPITFKRLHPGTLTYYAKFFVSRNTTDRVVVFQNCTGTGAGAQKTENLSVPSNNNDDIYFLVTENGNTSVQQGYWGSFDTWEDDTDTLFFVPNNTWCSYNYSTWGVSRRMIPCLYITFDGITPEFMINNIPFGVTDPNADLSSSNTNRHFVYIYRSIPKNRQMTKLQIYFNYDKGEPYVRYSSTGLAKWYDTSTGAHSNNVFGVEYDGWYDGGDHYIDGACGYYCMNNQYSRYILAGCITEHNDLTWTAWPLDANSLRGTGGISLISLYVTANDQFKYCYYDFLPNISASGVPSGDHAGQSRWDITMSDLGGYSKDNIALKVNGVSITDLSDYNKYIVSGNNSNIKILRAGKIVVSRDPSNGNEWALTIDFYEDERSHPTPSGSLDGVSGTVNGAWEEPINPIVFNSKTGRYETIVSAFAGDAFKYRKGEGEGSWPSGIAGKDLEHFGSGAVTTGESGSDIGISNTGIYAIGWCYWNSNPDKADGAAAPTVINFVYKLDDYDITNDIKSINSFVKRLGVTKSCEAITSNTTPGNLKTIYDELCAARTKNAIDALLLATPLDDYSYSDYVANGKSYTSISTTSNYTNALEKYNYIQDNAPGASKGAAYGSSFLTVSLGEGYSFTNIVIIIASSLTLLSITALSVLVIKKRKTKEQ